MLVSKKITFSGLTAHNIETFIISFLVENLMVNIFSLNIFSDKMRRFGNKATNIIFR